LVLLPGFCIAVVPLLHVLKTWLLQGLSWLLPWAPKPSDLKTCMHNWWSQKALSKSE
jgi:hypothetical protein